MPPSDPDSAINAALRQVEATEANVAKLERLWSEIGKLTPQGLYFGSDPTCEEQVRLFADILAALPMIDDWKPQCQPIDLNSIGQMRLDAKEIGEITAEIAVDEQIETPGRELAEYRHRLNRKRREMIRSVMLDLITAVDETLASISTKIPKRSRSNRKVRSAPWDKFKEQIEEIEMLLGSGTARPARWEDLRRHLHFGTLQDVSDIVRLDWPQVRAGLGKALFDANDPIPVDVANLGALASTQPRGKVITKLRWEALSDEDFERLIFTLISTTKGYENPQWLTHPNAPDRGRDLSVDRIIDDPLGGVRRERVIIQCRHWLTHSVSLDDVTLLKDQMALWEPPKVNVLVIATSGRFTTDAVAWIDKHNTEDRSPRIEMWPESHLEKLLAPRAGFIGEFGLR